MRALEGEGFRQGRITANGLEFAFLEAGSGPLVLCLHGFPDIARSFRYQLGALAEAGFRAVAPWMRGYAPTAIPADKRYDPAVLARDLIELIEAFGGGPAFVFGHDWGALAAYGAAVLAPDRIRKLAAASVPYGPNFPQALVTNPAQQKRSWYMFFFRHPLADAALAHEDFRLVEVLWADWSPGWSWDPREMEAVKETFRSPGVAEAALGYYRCALGMTPVDAQAAALQEGLSGAPIPVPALVLHGDRDGCVGSELYAGMEAFFPKGLRRVVVEGAGHFVHQEQPEFVNGVLLDFFRA